MKFLKLIKNFLEHLTEEPSAPIVDEPTSEKIIMETTTEDIVAHVRGWAINKIDLLHESDRHKNARALLAEFEEWIEPEGDELEIVSLEPED
jgi:hypothetical protein